MKTGPLTMAATGRAVLCAATATALLTSCGGGGADDRQAFLDQSPRAITKTAFAEMADVTSVRLLGTAVTDGGRARIDVRVDDEGRCAGSFDSDRGGATFIHLAEGTWLKPDETYWRSRLTTSRQVTQVMAEVGTSWTAAADDAGDVDDLCDLQRMLGGVKARKDGGDGRLSKGDIELVGDTEAIAIREKGRGEASTVWIAVSEPHRVVKIASREQGRPMSISFEEFGTAVDAEAPAADEVVDTSAYAAKRRD